MSWSFLQRLRDSVPEDVEPKPAAVPARTRPPLALAFVGDALYELYVRVHLVEEGKSRNLHRPTTALVRAAAQSRILGRLEPELTEEERAVVRQGRNANIGQVPKNASMSDYRRATAFECLLGHLFFTGQEDRLRELLEKAVAEGQRPETSGESISPL